MREGPLTRYAIFVDYRRLLVFTFGMKAFRDALKKQRGLGSAIARELRINRSAISLWKRIPAERVIDIERLTGVPREELRPDIYPTDRQ